MQKPSRLSDNYVYIVSLTCVFSELTKTKTWWNREGSSSSSSLKISRQQKQNIKVINQYEAVTRKWRSRWDFTSEKLLLLLNQQFQSSEQVSFEARTTASATGIMRLARNTW